MEREAGNVNREGDRQKKRRGESVKRERVGWTGNMVEWVSACRAQIPGTPCKKQAWKHISVIPVL